MEEERSSDRKINVRRDVKNSVLVSGDGNKITIFQLSAVAIVCGVVVILIGTSFGFFSQFNNNSQEQSKREILNLMADEKVKPGLLHVAARLLMEAQELTKRGDVNEALRYYRQVVTYTLSLRQQERGIKIPGQEHIAPSCPSKSQDQIDQVFCQAEADLAKLIEDSRLSKLKEELEAKNPLIGSRVEGKYFSSGENQSDVLFTPGALKTTFDILRLRFGAGADVDYSGQIYTLKEADRMPCKTLEDIEKLWRYYTGNRCGWYSESDKHTYADPDCKELDGNTLTWQVFNYPYDAAILRINQCGFLPVQLEMND